MPTPMEEERRRRIQVAVWAYSYEVLNHSIVDDFVYDRVCKEIDVRMNTDRADLDKWFRKHFHPDTGLWIYKHPELNRIKEIATQLTENDHHGKSKRSTEG